MYQPHCGLENVLMSWGHDGEDGWGLCGDGGEVCRSGQPAVNTVFLAEYLYQMMKFNKFSLPSEVGGGGSSQKPCQLS